MGKHVAMMASYSMTLAQLHLVRRRDVLAGRAGSRNLELQEKGYRVVHLVRTHTLSRDQITLAEGNDDIDTTAKAPTCPVLRRRVVTT